MVDVETEVNCDRTSLGSILPGFVASSAFRTACDAPVVVGLLADIATQADCDRVALDGVVFRGCTASAFETACDGSLLCGLLAGSASAAIAAPIASVFVPVVFVSFGQKWKWARTIRCERMRQVGQASEL